LATNAKLPWGQIDPSSSLIVNEQVAYDKQFFIFVKDIEFQKPSKIGIRAQKNRRTTSR
jgi:hypothetical protein